MAGFSQGNRRAGIKKKPPTLKSSYLRSRNKRPARTRRFLIFSAVLGLLGITLTALLFLTGFNPFQFKSRGEPVLELSISSEPAGATVYLEGEQGIPPARLKLPAGINQITVAKNGYGSFHTTLEVTGNPALGNNLPVLSRTVTLRPAGATLHGLPLPFPGAHLEYARFLSSEFMELTELDSSGNPLPPGAEGWPANLWRYNLSSGTTSPVVVSRSTLDGLLKASGAGGTSELALTVPALSADTGRLVLVARRLKSQNNFSLPAGNNQTAPTWDDETVWLARLSPDLSPAGALLTLPDPVPLFSLKELTSLLPGLTPPATGNFASGRFATVEQLYWSPAGDRLLAALKLMPTGSSNPLTVVLVLGTGGGTPPGLTLLATPQPLPLSVLPGTVIWSGDAGQVAFLTAGNNYYETQVSTALCLLDLARAGEREKSASSTTPLRYLAQVSGGKLWEQTGRQLEPTAERVYPASYGQSRYNPGALNLAKSLSDTRGVYGAVAPAWAQSGGKPFDTLYPLLTAATPAPLLDLGKPDGPAIRRTPGRDSSDKLRQDSFPFLTSQAALLYLSGQITSRDTGQLLSSASGLQLQIKELPGFSPPATETVGGVSLKILSEWHDPVRLPLLDKVTTPRFEAGWRPDGRGLVLAVPGSLTGQGGEFWLVDWNG